MTDFLSPAMLHRFARFIAVGSIQSAAGYLLYLVLIIALPYTVSFTIAFIFGILSSYMLNSLLVFQVRTSAFSLFGFCIYFFFSYLASLGGLAVLVELFKIDVRVAPLIMIPPMAIVNFLVVRKILNFFAEPSNG